MITDVPNKIHLTFGEQYDDISFKQLSQVSWCEDRIESNDVAYISKQFIVDNLFSRISEIDNHIKKYNEQTMVGQRHIHRLRGVKKELKEIITQIQSI